MHASAGELLLLAAFAALLGGEYWYWGWYRPIWNGVPAAEVALGERRARVAGQMASCVEGLLVLPVTRHGIFQHAAHGTL